MTREEAIQILWQYDVNFEPHPAEEIMHAIDMAIEALKERNNADSLVREESEEPKESKHELDLISRQAVTDVLIEGQDGSGQTYELIGELIDEVNALPSADCDTCIYNVCNYNRVPWESNGELIDRQAAVNVVHKYFVGLFNDEPYETDEDGDEVFTDMKSVNALLKHNKEVSKAIKALPSAEAKTKCIAQIKVDTEEIVRRIKEEYDITDGWIPVSERPPENIKPVIITWKNTDPASYYQYIVGKHFIGTAHYCNGKWFWYSSVCEDLLAEYGKSDIDELDEAIEVIAWMPLPAPYKWGDTE